MCGFAGLLTHRGGEAGSLERAARRMCDPIAHRGPDDQGSWEATEAGVAFGFRRLSIVDLSELGHQPMSSGTGRFTVVFNGEVYNHADLRRELENEGETFRGHSDTEVIVAAFERWGIEAAVARFIGMFAIAAWDAHRRTLSLIRDRLGIKPLFYYHRPGVLTFGSELKALVAGPEFDRELDVDALGAYLRYLYVPAPQTIYRHVRKLLPGHILTIQDPEASLPEPEAFWSVDGAVRSGRADPFRGSEEEAVEELERLLSDSVRLRMQADVPFGALLSGGIDSSSVVALMQANATRRTRTFSIGFSTAEYDEARHAAAVARHLGTDHTEMMVGDDDALQVVPLLPEMFDEPLSDPSQIPTYLVCRLARREVVVALSGDGGDEVFAGYNRYISGERMIGALGRVPRPVRRIAAAAVGSLSPSAWNRSYEAASPLLPRSLRHRLPGEKMGKLAHLLPAGSGMDMYRSLLSAWQHPDEILPSGARAASRVEDELGARRDLPLLDRMMAADQTTYLADDLLAKVDRASMATSLEARVPLLDHRVVEFGWRLPRGMKIREGQGKWLLRQVLYRHVPRELVERPKMGFSVPIGDWLRGALRPWGEALLFSGDSSHGPLRIAPVRQRWTEFQAGRNQDALALWTVLMFLAWKERWLG